ncbi:isoleucyl-tRNA synthetase [Nonlabens ulvanivorans]|uniref:Isoleucyl-tRNA synthetase n=1 Tax=Nonlabens ulvanivorans TaxID=906888 RepID=A0A081D877_NONUL|nr:isoleucyl-tRNA synthetase [Nonlabens ulvanivorans]
MLEKTGQKEVEVNGNAIILTLEDVEITSSDIEGWLVANQSGITVALDVTISPELKKEGISRELVNRIQNIRKDSGLEVTDRINIVIQSQNEIDDAVHSNEKYIMDETLADDLTLIQTVDNGTIVEFDDIVTSIQIKKI